MMRTSKTGESPHDPIPVPAGRRPPRRKATIVVFLAITLAALVCRASWLPWLADWLDVGKAWVRADVALALPGDDERRPFVAAALVNVGLVAKVLIVQNLPTPEELDGVTVPSHRIAQRIYEARGLQPAQILTLPSQTTSTIEDLAVLGKYLDEHPAERACVVTNAYHTRRTRWTIRHFVPHAASRIEVVSAPNPQFSSDTWWNTPRGLNFICNEYLKLGWYWVRYGSGVWCLATAVTLGIVYYCRKADCRRVLRFGQRNSTL